MFVKKIISIEYFPDGVTLQVEDNQQRIVMSAEWFGVNRPTTGDYLTQNRDGYYSVCRNNAFEAIRQVFHI
jgi:hypothetical protein